MHHQPLNFDRLRDDEISILSSNEGNDIVDAFESTLNLSPEPNVGETTARFITRFLACAPKADPSSGPAKEFLWNASSALMRLASCVPCDHYGQEILLRTVRHLDEKEPAWKDLSEFGMTMREEWNQSPIDEIDCDEDDINIQYTLFEWQNFNCFVAKLNSMMVNGFGNNFPIWEIRLGLEAENEKVPPHIFDARVRVACAWIKFNSRHLLRNSLLNFGTVKPDRSNPFATDPLFQGSVGFTLERWGFWKRRLMEIRQDADESLRAPIDEAVQIMTDLEEEVVTKGLPRLAAHLQVYEDANGA